MNFKRFHTGKPLPKRGTQLQFLWHLCVYGLNIAAVSAIRVGGGDSIAVQANMNIGNNRLYPGIAAGIGYRGYIKFQTGVKRQSVRAPVTVDKITGI